MIRFQPKYWGAWLLVPALRAVSLCPLPIIYNLGTILGDILYRGIPARRKIALQNLRLCFPDSTQQQLDTLTRQTFRNIARTTLSSGIGWWSNQKRLQRLVHVKNSTHYDRAIKTGRNLIILAPHFVSLEIGGIYLSTQSPIISIYQKSRNPVFDRLTLRGRTRFNAILVERQENTRSLIREMKKGVPLYYLPDQDPGIQWDSKRAVFAPFFGVQTATWSTLSRLAKLTDALVLPCATKMLSGGRGFEIIFSPPLDNFPSNHPIQDATCMNQAIESFVEHMPDQYFWVHKRFKTQPSGPGYYE